MDATVGHAKEIANWHQNFDVLGEEIPAGFQRLASGSQRTAYLHEPSGVVYKVGIDGCNRYEHKTLSQLRDEGHGHAPKTQIFTVEVTDYTDCQWGLDPSTEERDIIAMPYLPEDGSVPHDDVWLPGMVDFNPDNIHANNGRLWLIDAGGL